MSWLHGVDGAWEFLAETLRSGKALRARDREAIAFLVSRHESGEDVTLSFPEYRQLAAEHDDWLHCQEYGDVEFQKLREVADAADDYFNALEEGDEEDIEGAEEELAYALKKWKGDE